MEASLSEIVPSSLEAFCSSVNRLMNGPPPLPVHSLTQMQERAHTHASTMWPLLPRAISRTLEAHRPSWSLFDFRADRMAEIFPVRRQGRNNPHLEQHQNCHRRPCLTEYQKGEGWKFNIS